MQNYLTSVGVPFVSGGRFFTNAVNTRTRGADLVSTYNLDLRDSSIKFTAGANYNKTQILSIAANPAQLGLAGLSLPVIDRTEQGRITVGTPRTKAFVASDWTRGAWTLHGQLTRYGSFTSLGFTPSSDQTYGAKFVLDAAVDYAYKGLTLTFGANDLNNAYPQRNDAANNFDGILPYPQGSPFGFSGAYYYGTVAYKW